MNGEGMETPRRARRSLRESSLLKPVRRIVTGFDDKRRAILVSDGIPTRIQTLSANGATCYEIWSTRGTARIDSVNAEPPEETLTWAPPARGARMQVMDVLPEGPTALVDTAPTELSPAVLGRFESVDYVIVLQGEMTLILSEAEIVVYAGNIVVQLGTPHTWANRSGRLCRIALVSVEATSEVMNT